MTFPKYKQSIPKLDQYLRYPKVPNKTEPHSSYRKRMTKIKKVSCSKFIPQKKMENKLQYLPSVVNVQTDANRRTKMARKQFNGSFMEVIIRNGSQKSYDIFHLFLIFIQKCICLNILKKDRLLSLNLIALLYNKSQIYQLNLQIINSSELLNMSTAQKLRQNVQQQTKRLLSQLQQLQTLRQQLDDQQQYNNLRKSTLQQLQIFQQSLQNMIKDPNNSVLESQLQKTKRLIFQTIKQKFNQNQIKSKILESQVKGIRNQILQMDKEYHLKRISQKQYMKKRRNLVVRLEEAGIQLTKEQSQWLKTNQNFEEKGQGEENYINAKQNQFKIAQENLKKDL